MFVVTSCLLWCLSAQSQWLMKKNVNNEVKKDFSLFTFKNTKQQQLLNSKLTYNNVFTVTGGRRIHGLGMRWPSVKLTSILTSVHQEGCKKLWIWSVCNCFPWLFPRLPQVMCFPALSASYIFSAISAELQSFPPLSPTRFLSFARLYCDCCKYWKYKEKFHSSKDQH